MLSGLLYIPFSSMWLDTKTTILNFGLLINRKLESTFFSDDPNESKQKFQEKGKKNATS